MSLGSLARATLGPLFPVVGAAYRRLFVDVAKVAAALPVFESPLLDVGGGDGAVLNPLLDRQPWLRVTAVDLAPVIGQSIRADLRPRVDLRAGTSVREYIASGGSPPGAALLSDVLHHVRPEDRLQLVRDVLEAFQDRPPVIAVKEIVPQGVRSACAFWADRNISGDRGVTALSPSELLDLMHAADGRLRSTVTPLLDVDRPNYCVVFHR